jgi:Fe-S-cluster-containing hydrogenase component 2
VKKILFRKIVKIEEELCNGCGECVPNCAEGALQIIDGKARLVKDEYCDGLGACLGHCPQDAIQIIEREAKAFDEEAVHDYLNLIKQENISIQASNSPSRIVSEYVTDDSVSEESYLSHWPIQLNLVPVNAPFFEQRELLMVADCVPVAYPNLHRDLLKERAIVISCPKLDNAKFYVEKLTEIFKNNDIVGIQVLHMEVPCCSGLNVIVKRAVKESGRNIPIKRKVVTVKGEIL